MPACVAYLFERDMVAQPEERQEPEERQSGWKLVMWINIKKKKKKSKFSLACHCIICFNDDKCCYLYVYVPFIITQL